MMTVNEVSKLAGVSVRTLQYYDTIGLLKPAEYSESGYRLYDDTDLERLQQILLFRELEFPLKDIKDIINRSDFDKKKALDQQIELLTLKKEHLENLISFARELKKKGAEKMDFSAFDTSKIEEYSKKAKEQWGDTAEYKEYEEKHAKRSKSDGKKVMTDFMEIFKEFGRMKDSDPTSKEASDMVLKLKNYISEHFYQCSNEILSGLGQMYVSGNEFTENINKAGGEGTAEFVNKAIQSFCSK
ncbi:MAG: MerR family transcriptional regulator [Lachnospiraceae bacterium]|nr:MerR family transcriptional regulator [Lachnospiraceae bacterium]